jgi:hypothetical protein
MVQGFRDKILVTDREPDARNGAIFPALDIRQARVAGPDDGVRERTQKFTLDL